MAKPGKAPRWLKGYEGRLTVKKDGRICSYENPNKTFGTDATQAVRRFLEWEAETKGTTIPVVLSQKPPEFEGKREQLEKALDLMARAGAGFQGEDLEAFARVPEDFFWKKVRETVLDKPLEAAAKTGIPELANLRLLKPHKTAKLEEIGALYFRDKDGKLSPKEYQNSKLWWSEFCKITKCKTVAELTHEAFRHYRERIQKNQGDMSNVYARSRFGKVKTIINYASSEMDLSPKDREILNLKQLLKLPPKPAGKPVDIDREEIEAILKDANDFDTAMILVGLNCCFNPVDIARLQWSMIDFKKKVLAFDREKSEHVAESAIVRVACLWDRTIEALEKLRNDFDHVFVLSNRPIDTQTPNARFKRLVKSAGITRKITFTNLRDSGQTKAAEAGVAQQTYQCLSGHKLAGVDDNYIRRNPNFVKPACEAIERYYFGDGRAR